MTSVSDTAKVMSASIADAARRTVAPTSTPGCWRHLWSEMLPVVDATLQAWTFKQLRQKKVVANFSAN